MRIDTGGAGAGGVLAVPAAQERAGAAVAQCRSCGGPMPEPFLDLGDTPIANRLLRDDQVELPEPQYPLAIGFCPRCTLVQLTYALPAEAIFDADYPYYSSVSDALCGHARRHALNLVAARELSSDSLVVEVASNDGYLLRNFIEAGVPVLGIEPAPGPAAAARQIGVPTVEEFFTTEYAEKLRTDGLRADVIIANNVMAHVPDLNGFVAGLAILVADDGVITIENPGVGDLVARGEFDTVYHEHFCYFSSTAVERLLRRHGLFLNAVEHFPDLHGGTLRWQVSRRDQIRESARRHLAEEQERGVTDAAYYKHFSDDVRTTQQALVSLMRQLRTDGATIAAYGAAAKGATLLNSTGIGADLIDYVVDLNVHKQGLHMAGSKLPILDPKVLLERRPDYVLLLSWNFKEEILRQQAEYRRLGGRFVVPVPTPEIV